MEEQVRINPLLVTTLSKIYSKALTMLESNDDLKVQCKASEILMLHICGPDIDANFVRVVLDKSVIPSDKVHLNLVGSDQETAIEE